MLPVTLVSVSWALEPLWVNEELPPMLAVPTVPRVQVLSFVTVLVTVSPMVTIPVTGDGPRIGKRAVDGQFAVKPVCRDGHAVRVPPFSRPDDTDRLAVAPPPLMPTVSVLPAETVSSPTEKDASGTTTVASPVMHAWALRRSDPRSSSSRRSTVGSRAAPVQCVVAARRRRGGRVVEPFGRRRAR